jgi:uracil-DNA glycosylase family 4
MGEKTEKLRQIRDEVANLKQSPLFDYRKSNNYFPVLGEGNHDAKIMFIGEAPGENEAKTGRPFCGRAGKLLDELLASIDLPRADVYITNIVKDRPPANRDPLPEEINLYAPFLDRQIDIIKPKIIATLGRFSMAYIMERYGLKNKLDTIGRLHGRSFLATTPEGYSFLLIPLYHPAAAIYNQSQKATLFEDFKILKEMV